RPGPPREQARQGVHLRRRAAGPARGRALNARTVLIVDDDADLRGALADALVDEGYPVARAADGYEAMSYLRSHPAPALIFLDWMMPTCNGACSRRLQSQPPALLTIPVVVLTADMRIDEKKAEMDAREYLVKPVPLETLLDIVDRYVNER